MGRSRLEYRAKHKGILSENSRKQIREAKQAKQSNQQTVTSSIPEQKNQPKENSNILKLEENLEEIVEEGDVDLFTEPKLYYLESEFNNFTNDIQMKKRLQNPLLYVKHNICCYL